MALSFCMDDFYMFYSIICKFIVMKFAQFVFCGKFEAYITLKDLLFAKKHLSFTLLPETLMCYMNVCVLYSFASFKSGRK